ncbi:hypothetical protein ACLOJK_030538 [Asimina triloba]
MVWSWTEIPHPTYNPWTLAGITPSLVATTYPALKWENLGNDVLNRAKFCKTRAADERCGSSIHLLPVQTDVRVDRSPSDLMIRLEIQPITYSAKAKGTPNHPTAPTEKDWVRETPAVHQMKGARVINERRPQIENGAGVLTWSFLWIQPKSVSASESLATHSLS